MKECTECKGLGEVCYSCCGDNITGNDIDLCPTCLEHCSLEPEICECCIEPTRIKTPVQEFYDFVNANIYFLDNEIKEKYRELLLKERNTIVEAYEAGQRRESNDPFFLYGETYYHKKYPIRWGEF